MSTPCKISNCSFLWLLSFTEQQELKNQATLLLQKQRHCQAQEHQGEGKHTACKLPSFVIPWNKDISSCKCFSRGSRDAVTVVSPFQTYPPSFWDCHLGDNEQFFALPCCPWLHCPWPPTSVSLLPNSTSKHPRWDYMISKIPSIPNYSRILWSKPTKRHIPAFPSNVEVASFSPKELWTHTILAVLQWPQLS